MQFFKESLNTCTREGKFRIASVVGAALPAICIFGFGRMWPTDKDSASVVEGRPRGSVFAIAWTIITIAWFVSFATAAIFMSVNYLIALWVFNLLLVFMTVWWLYLYNKKEDKTGATQLLYFTLGFTIVTVLFLVCAPYNSDSPVPKMVSVLTFAPLIGWLLFASNLSLTEINHD